MIGVIVRLAIIAAAIATAVLAPRPAPDPTADVPTRDMSWPGSSASAPEPFPAPRPSASPQNRAAAPEATPPATAKPSPARHPYRRSIAPRRPTQIGRSIAGAASWYCLAGRSPCAVGYGAGGAYAAAGPRIRAALGPGWRGRTVMVSTPRARIPVTLIDWCSCPNGRLLDLYGGVMAHIAPHGLSDGVIEVGVAW